MTLDPITTEVVINRLREVAQVMAHALYHTGYSPILRESQDGSAGLTDAAGRTIVGGGGIPFHWLLYPRSVASFLARYPPEVMRDGDCFISNDPYKVANSHVPDVVVAAPVIYRGEVISFALTMAHKADVGGLVPGSSGAAAREIFHDGLLLPPVRYRTKDGVNPEIEAIIRNNSRVPDELVGDIRGQVGATLVGVARLQALCDEYSVAIVREAMASLIDRTAARLTAEFDAWPDGTADAEGYLDHDGADKDMPVRVRVRATKVGGRLTLDFSGSSPQGKGPMNTPRASAEAASLIATLALTDPTIPINSGVSQAVEFVMPSGTLINPQFPATVNNYFPVSHLTYNCVLTALGRINADRAAAPSGLGSGAIAIGYTEDRTGKPAVQYELMKMALGASKEHDGVTIGAPMNNFTPGTPVEILETEYPIEVTRFDLYRDSAGPGRLRGGVGYIREYRALGECILTVRCTNYKKGSWGVLGGRAPANSRATHIAAGRAPELLDCLDTRRLTPGDILRFEQAGGGGYGDPFERPAESVRADVENGYVSAEAAEQAYGVVLTHGGAIDDEATRALRARR